MKARNVGPGFLKSLDGVVAGILGPSGLNYPAPDRIRREYLVKIVAALIPLVLAAVVVNWIQGPGETLSPELASLVCMLACLGLLRAGYYRAAITVLFFGNLATVSVNALVALTGGADPVAFLPLTFLVYFATLTLSGLYSDSKTYDLAILVLALGFDIFEPYITGHRGASIFYTRMGVMLLHVIAYGIAQFLRSYFHRLSGLAEARKVMNRRLEQLVAEARNTGAMRLETFSHDLRSPLTSIMAVHELLADTKLDDQQKQYVDILGKSNRLLMDLIRSVLDSELPTAGQSRAQVKAQGNLKAVLEDIIATYRLLAQGKNLRISYRIFRNLPSSPPPAFLSRVLGNLIDNSLKYTDAGRISILVTTQKIPHTGEQLRIRVSDTGRGISAERLAEIKKGSYDPDPEISSSRGLGLVGVRQWVEASGGSVRIHSIPGKGTTVELKIPW
jgi:signal transduction histidine kinase